MENTTSNFESFMSRFYLKKVIKYLLKNLPRNAESMILIAKFMKGQHFLQIAAPLKRKVIFSVYKDAQEERAHEFFKITNSLSQTCRLCLL